MRDRRALREQRALPALENMHAWLLTSQRSSLSAAVPPWPSIMRSRVPLGVICNQPFSERPPSTMISAPTVHRDSSEARYNTAFATSSGVPKRPNGMVAAMSLLTWSR